MRSQMLIGLSALALLGATPGMAQESAEDRVDDIIVVARRSQTPIWEVSRGDDSLILVGSIRGLPRGFEWNPSGLEAATARADRILYPPVGRVSASDLLRVIWRARTIGRLPGETTSADYLDAATQARLETVMADEGDDWRRKSFVFLGFDLMQDKAGYRSGGDDADDVVRRSARRARIEGETVGEVRGDEIVDNLITQAPQDYVPCIAAGIVAAEGGPDGFVARAEDWRALRVPDVIENPLDIALGQCWPWGDPEIGPQLRSQWLTAIAGALDQPGTTLAVAPLRLLAEPGGVLDGLEAQGFEVRGPDWKASQAD
ncbi:GumN family protein [Brevundimonas subvibrioides ATCC 15264]|uniref:GumN family protein n=2 Tax=Brevundimonas subvibrioides TaxID=74313 RepID=D9QME0_BRESC|nr:GumN family protein [Brevundimonas subvibrioides ATCC 15264]